MDNSIHKSAMSSPAQQSPIVEIPAVAIPMPDFSNLLKNFGGSDPLPFVMTLAILLVVRDWDNKK